MAKRKDQNGEAFTGSRLSWTPAQSLEVMDKTGCTAAIMMIGGPGCWDGKDTVANNRTIAREINDFGAKMVSDHKSRIGLYASIGLPDTDGSLKEIAYAYDTLKADGIVLWSTFDGRYLGDPGFAPVLAELNRRKAVVYVHPTLGNLSTSEFDNLKDPLRALGVNWENTTRTIISMLNTGTLERCPDVKFIFSHGGGLLSTVAVRLAGNKPEKLAQLKNLYVDTAQTTDNPGAWGALRGFMEPSHVMFGSDHPYVANGLSDGLKHVKLDATEAAAIDHGYAERLFPRFRA